MARAARTGRVAGLPSPDRRFRRSRSRDDQSGGRRWIARVLRAGKVGLVTGGLVWAGVFAYTAVTASAWFSVQDVRVHGTARMSTGEVTMLLDGLYGRNVVVTSLEPWRERLLTSPWVKDASLRRVLPDTVDVVVTERVPVAIARIGRALQIVDAEGSVIDDFGPRYAALDLPLLEGWTPDAEGPQAEARIALAVAALGELSDAGLLWRLSQLDVSRPHDAVATLNGDPTRLHLGNTAFATRLQSYIDMAPRLQSMAADLEYVDLRFDDRVYIRPRRAGTTFTPIDDGRTSASGAPDVAADRGPDIDVIPDDVSGQD